MVWSQFDDAAAKSPKAQKAGNDAWLLWCGAVMYCNRHLTDGFVPLAALATECLPEPLSMARAKKLAERLVSANIHPDKLGLFERGDGGYWVHDFLDWNPSKAEVEAKRKADRDRKRGRGGSPPESTSDSNRIPTGIPSGIQPGIQTDSGPPRASARASPSPASPPIRSEPGHSQGSLPPRPVLPPELFPRKYTAADWPIPPPLLEYAGKLGLSDRERDSAIADYREKVTRTASVPWLLDKLCRFFEAAAEGKREERRNGKPVNTSERLAALAAELEAKETA